MSGTPEYRAYKNAFHRCTNPKHQSWNDYGGRRDASCPTGVKFRFTSFENFFMELGQRPSPEYSLDRISPNGDYEVGNVRWALKDVQAHNKRGQWIVTCEEIGLDEITGDIRYRTTATLYC
jgi:hypothetical protein